MEATSDYWKPVYFLLERERFECVLYQASQVKALPGRPKTDRLDSAWLARVTEARVAGRQLRAPGGDPPAPHAYPLPAQAGPDADRAEGAEREAAGGRAPEAVVSDQEFGATAAQDLIAETGTDMSAFPTAGHLASWARVAPRARESSKRKGKSATGRGNPYIGATLGETAASAGRTQTFLGAKLRRLCRHMPKKKAQGAVMRTQLVIARALLSDPAAEYRDLGPGYYEERAGTRRQARDHARAIERLGYKVTIESLNPDADPETGELITRTAS